MGRGGGGLAPRFRSSASKISSLSSGVSAAVAVSFEEVAGRAGAASFFMDEKTPMAAPIMAEGSCMFEGRSTVVPSFAMLPKLSRYRFATSSRIACGGMGCGDQMCRTIKKIGYFVCAQSRKTKRWGEKKNV